MDAKFQQGGDDMGNRRRPSPIRANRWGAAREAGAMGAARPATAVVIAALVATAAAPNGCGGAIGIVSLPPLDASVDGSSGGGSTPVPDGAACTSPGCGSEDEASSLESGISFDAGLSTIDGSDGPCSAGIGWEPYVNQHCPNGASTTLTGKVYDPAGNNPLFNVIVFIPRDLQGRIAPIAPGTSTCNACQDPIGDYVAATLTDEAGSFTLAGMPTGQNVPVVFQSGKWRREVFLTTQDCASTEVPAELSRLPRNQAEGDIPQMALVTGQCDRLACFLRSAGLDASEFTGPDRSGRLHVYRGAGPGPDLSGGGGGTAGDCSGAGGACPLWSTRQALERYHTVFLGCECAENNQTKPDMTPMHDWLDEGGQVFAIHAQDTWFKNGPADFQALATWVSGPASGATGPFSVDTSTPRGTSLDKWLANVAALNSDGTLPLAPADVSTSVSSVNSANAARWVYDTSQSPPATKYFSFGTPVGGIGGQAMVHCGRGVFSDVHVSGGGSMSSAAVPASCSGGDLSAEDKVLEFFLFDLPVCLETVTLPPPPPQCR